MSTDTFERLQHDMHAYQVSCVLVAMAELDLGTLLLTHGNSLTAAEASNLGGLDLRGCTALLDGLAALGYLTKRGTDECATYGVADGYAELLDSRNPATCIPIIRHMGCVQRRWSQLAMCVRDGTPHRGEPSILGADEDRVSFIMGMNSIACQMKDTVLDAISRAGILPLARPDARILDIGGASGTYTEAFLDRMPRATAAIFDLPVGIAQARRRFAGHPMEARVQLVQGDFTKDALPAGFDFAWISAIIHQMDRAESRALYTKARDALNPGGILAVRDFVMNRERTFPVAGALFGLNMLASTGSGRVYTLFEIRDDLERAGFTDVRLAVDAPTMGAVVTARKPEA